MTTSSKPARTVPSARRPASSIARRTLFEEPESHRESAETEWNRASTQRSLDELFACAGTYTSSREFSTLIRFVGRFRFYSPFNAMLAHVQMPGARFVAPAYRWGRDYGRRVKPNGRPIVLLKPNGPVLFAFDVSDTEPLPDVKRRVKPVPKAVERPFAVRGTVGRELQWSIENAKRDGIRVAEHGAGSLSAGRIGPTEPGAVVRFQVKERPKPRYIHIPVRYDVLLNSSHTPEEQYATLVHELAHLYCGHLGTPDERWWPDRPQLSVDVEEFEAESVAYLVCRRLGIKTRSAAYLAGYLKRNDETPDISLDCVLKAAGLVEAMGCGRMKVRKHQS